MTNWLGLSFLHLYIEYLKINRIRFFKIWSGSLSIKKPNMALWGVRVSRLIAGLKNSVTAIHNLFVMGHSQKKWIGVSSKVLHKLQADVSEKFMWWSLKFKYKMLCRILNWKNCRYVYLVMIRGRRYIFSQFKFGPNRWLKYNWEVGGLHKHCN